MEASANGDRTFWSDEKCCALIVVMATQLYEYAQNPLELYN